MASRSGLERVLADLDGFEDPSVEFEQYATPAAVAAHLVHLAALNGDLDGTVVDLGAGTGILAIGAALRDARRVIGVERDPAAIAVAERNADRVRAAEGITWLRGDATRPPLCARDATVLMNPPFGAQAGATHADREFLAAAAAIAAVTYSIHNAGSRAFVEAFAADVGGAVTQAFEARLAIDRQFDFHTADRDEIGAEVYRIEWG